ncbi:MAG: 30S ribosomal protein S6 [Saprospiraceae bacterium]|nr:30S ribosomal protein S6 [Saprospiraceae bacterium]
MKNYEVTFIVDPVLSGDEIKATAQTYVDHLTKVGCTIVHVDEMGLQQLAYPINKRTSGVYYCIEFSSETGELIGNLELSLYRDERVMRFLTVSLDKFGVKYNKDKREGKIGSVKKKEKKASKSARPQEKERAPKSEAPVKEAPVKAEAPAKVEAPVAEAPKAEEEE